MADNLCVFSVQENFHEYFGVLTTRGYLTLFRFDEELTVDENNRLADDNYYVKGCGKNLQMVEIDKAKSHETELKLINFYGQEKTLMFTTIT